MRSLTLLLALLATPAQSQLPELRTFSSTPSCARCTIVVQPRATLRLPGDSLSFDIASSLVRLSNGGFVATDLSETNVPALFDSTGRFVRLVSREGQGPGELDRHNMDPIFVGPGDSVWVISSWRMHVFTPDMRYARLDTRISGEDWLFPSPDGQRMVVGWIGTGPRSRHPLHIIDVNGKLLHSFGVEQPLSDPRQVRDGSVSFSRKVVRGEGGTFWVHDPTTFLLEQYDFEGRLLARAKHASDGWYADAERTRVSMGFHGGPGIGVIQQSGEPGVLWLVYSVSNASFARGRGTIVLSTRAPMYDVIVEAFDTRSMTVLATTRIPRTLAIRLDNARDMLAVVQPIDDVFHGFQVSWLQLVRR